MIIPPSHNAISKNLRADNAELKFRTPNNKNFLNNAIVWRIVEIHLHPLETAMKAILGNIRTDFQ